VGIAGNQTGYIEPIFVGDAHRLVKTWWAKAVSFNEMHRFADSSSINQVSAKTLPTLHFIITVQVEVICF